MSKAKAQGTRYENQVRDFFKSLGYPAERIAEGGSLDEGDVAVSFYGSKLVAECKARQNLNVQLTIGKALKKAGHDRTVVFWKRLVRTEGASRRTVVAGVAEVVIMTPETFKLIIESAYEAGVDSV